MIFELITFFVIVVLILALVWRVSKTNETLYDSPLFKGFILLFGTLLLGLWFMVGIIEYPVAQSILSVGGPVSILAGFLYLTNPQDMKLLVKHLIIVGSDLAPPEKWVGHPETGPIKVKSVGLNAVSYEKINGETGTIMNDKFLEGNPTMLHTVQPKDSPLCVYFHEKKVSLPLERNVNYGKGGIMTTVLAEIVANSKGSWMKDGAAPDGSAVDQVATGFVFGDTHYQPRAHIESVPGPDGSPHVDITFMIPAEDYEKGWSWESMITQACLNAFYAAQQGA